jgi:hypothetical protein
MITPSMPSCTPIPGVLAMITETLTKLDAARRQTDEAIRMVFEGRDTVSAHTIAAAAAEVLADLAKHHGIHAGWTRGAQTKKPEDQKKLRAGITKFERFFKHADGQRGPENDALATLDFHPEATPLVILESIEMLRRLTGKFTWEGLLFTCWMITRHPDLILDGEIKTLLTTVAATLPLKLTDENVMTDFLKMRQSLPVVFLEQLL